jgi:transcriptional regulator with XRE-family HTH domain
VPKPLITPIDAVRLKVLGAVLCTARQNLRYSYRELATLSGVSASQLLRMESGEFDYSLAKFIRVCEPLGLSAGIAIEAALLRGGLAMKFHRVEENLIEAFLRRQGISKAEVIEEKVLIIRELVMDIASAVAVMILASNAQAMRFYIEFPFPLLNDPLQSFVDTSGVDHLRHYERVALLQALAEGPYKKLMALDIINEESLAAYLKWKEKHKAASIKPTMTWGAGHVARPKPQEDAPPRTRAKK